MTPDLDSTSRLLLTVLRNAVAYEEAALAQQEEQGSPEDFLPGSLRLCRAVAPLVAAGEPSAEVLAAVHRLTRELLLEGDFYPGVMTAAVVRHIDNWLSDLDPTYWHRSLWGEFRSLF